MHTPDLAHPRVCSVRTVARLVAVRELLTTRDFRFLFGVRLVGQGGDGMLQAALATFVLFSPERQPDAVKVAASFAILLIPYSVIGPFAGVFLDRWSRRQVLVRANLLKALFVLPILALVAAGNDGPILGIAVLVVLGIGRFVLAGISASLPHVVSGRDLVTANALTPTSGTIMSAVGALVGVTLARIVGGGDTGSVVVLVIAAIAYISASTIARPIGRKRLGPDGSKPSDSVRGVVLGLLSGIHELRVHREAGRAVTVVACHRIALGVLTVGGLLLVRNTFQTMDEADAALGMFAVLTGATALGALIGAVLTPGATRRWGTVPWSTFVLLQAGILGTTFVLLGSQLPSYAPLLLGALSLGFCGQSLKVCSDTLIQRFIPDDHLGRVFALFDMIVNVTLVLGVTAMAFLAPASGQAPAAYLTVGVLLVCAGLWYRWRGPRRVRVSTDA